MRCRKMFCALFAAPLLAASVAPGLADRKPTTQERAHIESLLREKGFKRWSDITFYDEDQVWEVDEVIGPDGREQDLLIDPTTWAITEHHRD